ncbi:hypothetical protein FHV99_004652 [Ochrobactrum sp. P20RRXII]|nr:hypothetical protein [Ochrobactrum sp. P20RRXII]NIH77400.1 hypothetical protein [Ochrobactrum sp. P20RRXII]
MTKNVAKKQNATNNAPAQNKYVLALATRIDAEVKKGTISAPNLKMLHNISLLLGVKQVEELLDSVQCNVGVFTQNMYALKKLQSMLKFLIDESGKATLDAFLEPAMKTIKLFIVNEREIFTSLDSRKSFSHDYITDKSESGMYAIKRGKTNCDAATCDTQSSSNSVVLEGLNILNLLSAEERATFSGRFKTHKINTENAMLKAVLAKL